MKSFYLGCIDYKCQIPALRDKRYQLLKNSVLQPQNDNITALATKTPLKMNMGGGGVLQVRFLT